MYLTLLIPTIFSFIITVLLVPINIYFAKKYRLVDDPKKHKHPAILHRKPIPRAGGLSIFIAIAISVFVFLPINPFMSILLFAGLVVVVTGIFDDKYDLSPYLRFGLNIFAATLVVASGVNIPFITNPLGGVLYFNAVEIISIGNFVVRLSDVLAVIWIVWVMNMLNWSKGVDGQMPGIAAISAIVIGIGSLRFTPLGTENIIASQLSFITAGAAIGFLLYNFYPAKIFPGYSATILGFLIGVLSITSGIKLATAVLVMGVPTVDAIITIFRRILAKKSPFWHDRGHLHHLLLNYGLGHRSIAVFYWLMSLLLGVVALSASSRGKLFAIMLVIVVVVGFVMMLRFSAKSQDYD